MDMEMFDINSEAPFVQALNNALPSNFVRVSLKILELGHKK